MRIARSHIALLILSASVAFDTTSRSQVLTVDQEYIPGGVGGDVLSPYMSGLGQEFTPRWDSLDFVNVPLDGGTGPANFQVKIHEGGISGRVLGTSLVTPGTGSEGFWTEFWFDSTLSLVPNSLYTFEVLQLSGNSNWGMNHLLDTRTTYDFGNAVVGGFQQPWDFTFQEGFVGIPEPSMISLWFVGAIAAIVIRKVCTPASS